MPNNSNNQIISLNDLVTRLLNNSIRVMKKNGQRNNWILSLIDAIRDEN